MKYVFIDTNIYLNFYRRAEHNHAALEKLRVYIRKDQIKLIVTDQVTGEFIRRRPDAINEVETKIEGLRNAFVYNLNDIESLPSYTGGKKTKGKLSEIVKRYRKEIDSEINQLSSKYKKSVIGSNAPTNRLIRILFNNAVSIVASDEIIQRSTNRTQRGFPPRKGSGSIGDAINWEILLGHFSQYDLIVVSGDGDYSNNHDKTIINPYLEYEWEHKFHKKVKLYTTFGEFINSVANEEIVTEEVIAEEKDLAVQNFYNTSTPPLHLSTSPTTIFPEPNITSFAIPFSIQHPIKTCQICGKPYIRGGHSSLIMDICDDCSIKLRKVVHKKLLGD